jgi:MYXO-CTERM domain-containing protein
MILRRSIMAGCSSAFLLCTAVAVNAQTPPDQPPAETTVVRDDVDRDWGWIGLLGLLGLAGLFRRRDAYADRPRGRAV